MEKTCTVSQGSCEEQFLLFRAWELNFYHSEMASVDNRISATEEGSEDTQ